MTAGRIDSRGLVRAYLDRIERVDRSGPTLRAILEVNPDAESIAIERDAERRAGKLRGPLHGIPIVLKDNIDTADGMHTTAGSLALLDSRPDADATVARRLRDAGAVLLGKTNLSEWANMRSDRSSSGWSGRGGQTLNPHSLDRSPCGSSSGSAVAVAAGLAAAAIGTETVGSIICPSSLNGVVGIKPTVGLTSRAGVIPISHSQDTVGPHARTVADAALLLAAIAGLDPRDPATTDGAAHAAPDYAKSLQRDGLRGARIGVPRTRLFGYSEGADQVAEAAIATLRAEGAVIIDPADIPNVQVMYPAGEEVMLHEFKSDLAAYLATRKHPGLLSLGDLIAWNRAHAAQEMPWFGQDLFEKAAAKGPLSDEKYTSALARSHELSRTLGIDAVMEQHHLDALVAPAYGPAWKIDLVNGDNFAGGSALPAGLAGYPMITVPAGIAHGLPVGLAFIGRAWSEPTLIRLAYAFEQASQARRRPAYRRTTP